MSLEHLRRSLEVADGTLLPGEVVLPGMTGQAETPGRGQLRDTARSMAGRTILVRIDRRPVSGNDLVGDVAAGAGAAGFMMVDVAAGAGDDGRVRPKRHCFSMASGTPQPLVLPVLKGNGSGPRGMGHDRNGNRHRPAGSQLG